MSDPDTIRANIEATRLKTANDVDALADKVSPHNIADRQKEKVKDRVRSARESVMGVAHSAADKAHSAADAATDALPDGKAPVAVAQGHPIVVGLVAFGAGWLLSSLLPTFSGERAAASAVKEKTAPLVDAAKDVAKDAAKDAAQQLKEPAKDAAEHLKGTVTDAASTVKEEGQSAASDVKGTAVDAKDDVAGAARNG